MTSSKWKENKETKLQVFLCAEGVCFCVSLHRYQHTSRSAAPESLRCWQVSLGEIGLASSVTQDSSYYSAGTAAAAHWCVSLWTTEAFVSFVKQRCKKKVWEIQVQPIHLLHPIQFSKWLCYQANLFTGTSGYSEFLLVCCFFILIKLFCRPVERLYLGGSELTPTSTHHHHHLSGSSQVLWSKGRKRIIPNDKLAVWFDPSSLTATRLFSSA